MQESQIWPVMWENDRPSEGGAAAIGQRGEASLRKATLEGPWLMSPMYWYNDLYTMHIYKYLYIIYMYTLYIIHWLSSDFWILLEFFISCHFFPQIGVDVLSDRAGLQSPHHEILAIQESAPKFFGSGRSQDPIHTFQQKLLVYIIYIYNCINILIYKYIINIYTYIHKYIYKYIHKYI